MDIVSKHRKPNTPVGLVKSAYRNNENIVITTLSSWKEHMNEIEYDYYNDNRKFANL